MRGMAGGEAHLAREETEEEEEVPRPTREESELRMEAAAEEDLRERRSRGEKTKMGDEADGDRRHHDPTCHSYLFVILLVFAASMATPCRWSTFST